MSYNTWADWSETIDSLYYKLLSYFGRQDIGAHGLVCVPSVPETLSGIMARGDVITPIKQGPDVW